MLAPDAKADQPGRNALKHGKALKEAEREGHFIEDRLAHDKRCQHTVVDGLLHRLHHPCRKKSSILHLAEERIDVVACRE